MRFQRPSPKTLRRLLLAGGVLAALWAGGFLGGCASVDLLAAGGSETWDPMPVRAPAKVITTVHIEDAEELRERCSYRGSSVLWGCAKFITDEICVIYHAQPTMTSDVDRHERRHCAGFVHRSHQ